MNIIRKYIFREPLKIHLKVSFIIITLAAIFIGGCGSEPKQLSAPEYDKTFQVGPFSARLELDKTKINIAQTVYITVETVIAKSYGVKLDKAMDIQGDFEIIEQKNIPEKLANDNKIIHAVILRLSPNKIPSMEIPPISIGFYDVNSPNTIIYTIDTEPIKVDVAAVLTDANAVEIADIAGVVEIKRNWPMISLVLFLAITAVIVLLVWIIYKRKNKPVEQKRVYKTAHEIALAAMEKLLGKNLTASGKVKLFYEEITDIVRHYIENRFDINAPDKTTDEFLIELKSNSILEDTDKKNLAEFLTHCDLVKFAKYQPTDSQVKESADLAGEFVEKTKSEDKLVDVTDMEMEGRL